MSDMKWTTEYPKESGYYWIRNLIFQLYARSPISHPEPQIIDLGDDLRVLEIWFEGHRTPLIRDQLFSAEWYGPIQPPD